MKETITMSTKEADRIHVLDRLKGKEIKQKKAAELLGLSVRQVRRLLSRYKREGVAGIPHKLRGIVSNNKADQTVVEKAIETVRDKYKDFSVAMAHEKLVEFHNFPYSDECLRQALIVHGLHHPKKQKSSSLHLLRERRPSEGELVQIDGSPHSWFEDRGPYCTLLVFIDDATGKLKWLQFVEAETTNAYFQAVRQYLLLYGKPLAWYSDKHGVFRVNTTKSNSASVTDSNGVTQFGRAMGELSIETIFANTPQAKGRVERANQTLQDRLVKEMRLRGIRTMEEGNLYLPEFRESYNDKFAVVAKSTINMHRPLTQQENLDDILVQKHQRIVSKNLSFSYENKLYQLTTNRPSYALKHARITILEDNSGTIKVFYNKEELPFQILTIQPKTESVDTKQLNNHVDQLVQRVWLPQPATHPWKQPYLHW